MNKRIDLHIHTTKSDGFFHPLEVLEEAYKNQVKVISITDHDAIDAYTDKLFELAKEKNIRVISGVEISTKIKKCGIHVLGYNIDLKNKALNQKLYMLRNARHDYLFSVTKKLNALGYIVNLEKLEKIDSVTKAHIALDIIENRENKEKLWQEFGHIPEKGEFIETIMNEGCPAYTKKEAITPKEAADLIRQAGGVVVLAHPVAYKWEDNLTSEDILKIVKDMNADGIEANYIYVDKNNNKINEVDFWMEFAKTNHLSFTIGSDFHNIDGIRPMIGLEKDLTLSEQEVNEILKLID